MQQDPHFTDAYEADIAASLATIVEHWDGIYARPGLSVGKVGANDSSDLQEPMAPGHLEARALATSRMRGWGQVLLKHGEETGVEVTPPPPAASGVDLADWLWQHVYILARHEAAPNIARELGDSARDIERQSEPQRPETMYVGACPRLLEDSSTCGGEVRSRREEVRPEDERPALSPDTVWCRCKRCGEEAVARKWIEWGMHVAARMSADGFTVAGPDIPTLAHAEFGLRVAEQTVWTWTNRGHITPLPGHSRPRMFALEEVLAHLRHVAAGRVG